MNLRHATICTALLCSTGALHAQVCSGPGGGGMDITGNECNDSASSLTLDDERKSVGPPPALQAASDSGEQVSGGQGAAVNVEGARLDALLAEQPSPASSAELPED